VDKWLNLSDKKAFIFFSLYTTWDYNQKRGILSVDNRLNKKRDGKKPAIHLSRQKKAAKRWCQWLKIT